MSKATLQKDLDARILKVESELLQLKQYSKQNLKINPDYAQIKTFLNDPIVNEDSFRGYFESLISGNEYRGFIAFLRDENLSSDHNLYFFWVYLFELYKGLKRAYKDEDFKIKNQYNKELKELKEKFDFISDSQQCKTPVPYDVHSININFRTDTKEPYSIKINSPQVLNHIFEQVHELVNELVNELTELQNRFKKFELIDVKYKQPIIKNKRHYYKQFIYQTKPLFEYLKDKHFKSKNEYEIHTFIADFVELIGYNWGKRTELDKTDYIRKCYSAKTSTKNS